jgi:ferredoxin-NADP reductase
MVTTGSHVVVVAGGIGITPYLSILSSIPAVEEEGKVTLIWSTRDEAFANFLINNRRLEKIVRNNVEVHVHITRGEREGTNEEEEVRKEEEEVRGGKGDELARHDNSNTPYHLTPPSHPPPPPLPPQQLADPNPS